MGTLLASALISQASEIIQDESNVQMTTANALGWLNDAQRAIVIVKPDASTVIRSITLVPGTKQSIAGLKLMSVVRNMGASGSTPGRAIRLVERGIKDEFEPDWHSAVASSVVKEYVFDDRLDTDFYVSPPVIATATVQIEVSESINPADIATINDAITIDDIYSPALIEWIVYRYIARDAEETPSLQRTAVHFQSFFGLLGAKVQTDMAINPKLREHLS